MDVNFVEPPSLGRAHRLAFSLSASICIASTALVLGLGWELRSTQAQWREFTSAQAQRARLRAAPASVVPLYAPQAAAIAAQARLPAGPALFALEGVRGEGARVTAIELDGGTGVVHASLAATDAQALGHYVDRLNAYPQGAAWVLSEVTGPAAGAGRQELQARLSSRPAAGR